MSSAFEVIHQASKSLTQPAFGVLKEAEVIQTALLVRRLKEH